MEISVLRSKVDKLMGQRDRVLQQLKEAKGAYIAAARDAGMSEETQLLLKRLAAETQKQVELKVTSIGSAALAATLGPDWALGLQFTPPEGKQKTQAEFHFLRGPDMVPTNPLEEDSGGGAYMAAFGLRCATMRMRRPLLRQSCFLDEPIKDINDPTRVMHEEFAQMIHRMSRKGIQFLIVSMVPELIEIADKVFDCKKP